VIEGGSLEAPLPTPVAGGTKGKIRFPLIYSQNFPEVERIKGKGRGREKRTPLLKAPHVGFCWRTGPSLRKLDFVPTEAIFWKDVGINRFG
jgi:hypothetical protein